MGPTGSDLSTDGGETWTALGTLGFHAVGFAGPVDGGWGVGEGGLIAPVCRGRVASSAQRRTAGSR